MFVRLGAKCTFEIGIALYGFGETYRIAFDEHGCLLAQPLIHLQIITDIAKLLLNLAHGIEVSRPVKRVPAHQKELDEVTRHVASSNIKTTCEMGEGEAIVDWDDMGDTISRVDDNAGREAL